MSGINDVASSGTSGDVTQAGTNNFTGTNTFNVNRPTSTIGGGVGLTGDDFITKDDFDTLTTTSDVTQAGTNNFTGTNTFNVNRPTSTIAGGVGLAGDDFITKDDFDTLTNVSDVTQAGTNNFTGTNTFNTSRPTSTIAGGVGLTDNNFITKRDFEEDLRDGMIIQVKHTYYRGFQKNVGSSVLPQIVNDLKVEITPKSSNSVMKVSFLIHYGAPGSFNFWGWNTVTVVGANNFVIPNSNSNVISPNTNALGTAGNTIGSVGGNQVFNCAPISNTFIDENPGSGTLSYSIAVRPYGAASNNQQNAFSINTIDQEGNDRPKYCSYIMAEEIYKKP